MLYNTSMCESLNVRKFEYVCACVFLATVSQCQRKTGRQQSYCELMRSGAASPVDCKLAQFSSPLCCYGIHWQQFLQCLFVDDVVVYAVW